MNFTNIGIRRRLCIGEHVILGYTYVDIYQCVPGLTGYNQGKSSSLYRPSRTHPHTVCGYTI